MIILTAEHVRQADRAAVLNALIADGVDSAVADHWCDRWETEARRSGMTSTRDYFWDTGAGWIDAQRELRKQLA